MFRHLRYSWWAGSALAGASACAQVTFPASLPSVSDSAAWSQLGAEFTTVNQSFSALTGLSTSVSGLLGGSDGVTVVANSAWIHQTSGFADGDTLLWAENSVGAGSGAVTLSFAAQNGAGAFFQTASPGQFTAELDVYNGANLLATHTYTSDANGDPVYMGALSATQNITKLVFQGLTVSEFAGDPTDFAVDTLQLDTPGNSPVPETSPALAGGAVLGALLCRQWLRRRTQA